MAIAPPAREWRGRRALAPAELAQRPLILYERGGVIRRVIDGWFRKAGARPHVAMELGNAEAIKELVGAGLGVSISSAITVSAEVRRGSLIAIPLTPPLARELAIIRRRNKSLSPAVTVVVQALESFEDTQPSARRPRRRAPSERRLRRRNPNPGGRQREKSEP